MDNIFEKVTNATSGHVNFLVMIQVQYKDNFSQCSQGPTGQSVKKCYTVLCSCFEGLSSWLAHFPGTFRVHPDKLKRHQHNLSSLQSYASHIFTTELTSHIVTSISRAANISRLCIRRVELSSVQCRDEGRADNKRRYMRPVALWLEGHWAHRCRLVYTLLRQLYPPELGAPPK